MDFDCLPEGMIYVSGVQLGSSLMMYNSLFLRNSTSWDMTPTATFFHWNHTPSRDIMHCNNWRQHYAAWMRYVCVWVRGRGYASEWLLVAAILAISMRIAVTSNHIKLKAFPTCSHRPNYGVQAQVWKVTHGHYLYLFKWCITTASCCLFA